MPRCALGSRGADQRARLGYLPAAAFFSKGATPVAAKAEAAKVIEKAAKVPKPEKPAATQPASETATTTHEAPAAVEPAADSPSEAPAVTLEQVRAKLAVLSQGGKKDAVVALLKSYGASTLSAVAPGKFGELLAKAEAL